MTRTTGTPPDISPARARALRVVRASALYDLLVTGAFALPVTASAALGGLRALHEGLGLTGAVPDAADPFTLLFASLMGGLVTVWSLYRLARPSLAAGAADVGGRAFFSLGMATALLAGASPLVAAVLALEVAWGVVQAVAVLTGRRPVMRGTDPTPGRQAPHPAPAV